MINKVKDKFIFFTLKYIPYKSNSIKVILDTTNIAIWENLKQVIPNCPQCGEFRPYPYTDVSLDCLWCIEYRHRIFLHAPSNKKADLLIQSILRYFDRKRHGIDDMFTEEDYDNI